MDFETAVNHILRYEGVDSDDPLDRGGRTRFGIAQASHPNIDVPNITIEQAKAIYRREYWDRVRADGLPPDLRLPVFDAAVNHGVSRAIKMLQRAAGVKADGKLGPVTLAALRPSFKEVEIWIRFMAERASAYAQNEQFDRYGKGWMRRLADVAYTSLRRT